MPRWFRRREVSEQDIEAQGAEQAEEAAAPEQEAVAEDSALPGAATTTDGELAPDEAATPEGEGAADLEHGLDRTRRGFFSRIGKLLRRGDLDEDDWEEIEGLLIQADVGVETTLALVERLRERVREERLHDFATLQQVLHEELVAILDTATLPSRSPEPGVPFVVLTVGVNGVGKTTTIAKLAQRYRRQGYSVLLAAADTFRAAAIEQLQVWGERAGVPVLAHQSGADPGAVAFDAISAAMSRGTDVVIVDTAGRLHTKHNLMRELEKVHRVIQRKLAPAPQEVLLVIDATTGQNGLIQARVFAQAVQVTQLALAKLDGTAKGGIAFAIVRELGLPIAYVGTGEGLEDLADFDSRRFVTALLGEQV